MTKVTDAAIGALLLARPGLTAGEIESHFRLTKAAVFGRLIKLAARRIIRCETQSTSIRPGPRHATTGAQVRRYFAPLAPVAAE